MNQAKVKLTDIETGQEYLLLATKMNLKGILVETARIIKPGSSLRISIQLEDGREPVTLQAEVHKIAERPDGGKGMILRFVDPPHRALKRIEKYLEQAQNPGSGLFRRFSRDKTMMVDLNTLSRLNVAAEEEKVAKVSTTRDEEAVHAARPGLDGATRISEPGEIEAYVRSHRRSPWLRRILILGIVTGFGAYFLNSMGPILRFIDRTFALRPPTEIETFSPTPRNTPLVEVLVTITPSIEKTAQPSPTPIARIRTPRPQPTVQVPAPKPLVGNISRIEVEPSETFVKITIKGTGDLSPVKVTRATNPRRLLVDFPNVPTFSAERVISVTQNPLLQVRTTKKENGVRVTLDLYPVNFPPYDVKEHNDSVDIFLHR